MSSEQSRRPLARMVPPGARAARGKLRRRLSAWGQLVAALTLVGGLYASFAPGVGQAQDTTPKLSESAQAGKRLYEVSCVTCHGQNAQGVNQRGPSLIGVGSAAVEFQVNTGRMPLARQEAQAERKDPQFNSAQAKDLGQYIQELGGGPQLPDSGSLANDVNAAKNDPNKLAHGGELFRVNCSSCHAFSTGGGALSSGKFAPSLESSKAEDIYAAMLTGPQNMPVFGNSELTPQDKADIIAYIQNLNSDQDPGGWGLGRFGPVPEGLVIFLVGIAFLIFATLWIAGKS